MQNSVIVVGFFFSCSWKFEVFINVENNLILLLSKAFINLS